MPKLALNAQEMEALYGLTHLQQLLYFRAIRPYMDAATGLVGSAKRRISYQSAMEAVYVNPNPGRKQSGCPSLSQVKRAFRALEKAGLITINSDKHHLMVQCLLADNLQHTSLSESVPACAQNKPVCKADLKRTQDEQPAKPIRTGLEENCSESAKPCLTSKPVPPLNKEENKKNKKTRAREENVFPGFSQVQDDYQPSLAVLGKLKALGLPHPTAAEVLLFVSHYRAKAISCADWDAAFLKWLLLGQRLQQSWQRPTSLPKSDIHYAKAGRAVANLACAAVNRLPLPPTDPGRIPAEPVCRYPEQRAREIYFQQLSQTQRSEHLRKMGFTHVSQYLAHHNAPPRLSAGV